MNIETDLCRSAVQTLIPILRQVLKASDDYMEVWRVPSATRAMSRSMSE
jgi:hypothetical protein